MAATSDFHDLAELKPARREGADALIFRAVSFVFGASLLVAGLGLWLVPGSSWSAELMLIKLALTGLFTLGGVSFLQAGRRRRTE